MTALDLLVGFEVGLYTRQDVSAWVDGEVQRLQELPEALLELTTLRNKDEKAIRDLLACLAPEVTRETRAAHEVTAIRELWTAHRVDLPRCLHQLARSAEHLPDDEREHWRRLDYAYDLAESGVHGSLQDVRVELDAFLDRFFRRSDGH